MDGLKLTRTLQTGCVGKDVEGVTRAMLRYLVDDAGWRSFTAAIPVVRRTWGPGKTRLAKRCQAKAGISQTGAFGPVSETKLRQARAFDAKADRLLDEYATAHPQLVEPKQGFKSLHESLWDAYSVGRRMGLTDLGTYNPASTLPGGGPSDHSVFPARAFDLGCNPQTGWQNATARAFFEKMVGRPEVEYVILGDRIWSVARGLHTYTAGGHLNHVHVSGRR